MDWDVFGGSCDPYAKLAFAGRTVKSAHKTGRKVALNVELAIPFGRPTMSSVISLSIYDYDRASDDDRVATTRLRLADAEEGVAPHWVNLYGAPEGEQGKAGSAMNRGNEDGSYFRGRALVSMWVTGGDDAPRNETVGEARPLPADRRPVEEDYAVQMDLYEGANIPVEKYVTVAVRIGEFVVQSEKAGARVSGRRAVGGGGSHGFMRVSPSGESRRTGARAGTRSSRPRANISRSATQRTRSRSRACLSTCCSTTRSSRTPPSRRRTCLSASGRVSGSESMGRYASLTRAAPPAWHTLREERCFAQVDKGAGALPGSLLFSLRMGARSRMPAKPSITSRPTKDVFTAAAAVSAASAAHAVPAKPPQRGNVGALSVVIHEAKGLPALNRGGPTPAVTVGLINGARKFTTAAQRVSSSPRFGDRFVFHGAKADAELAVNVEDCHWLWNKRIGAFKVDLLERQRESGVATGSDWRLDKWYVVSGAHPGAELRIELSFTFEQVPAVSWRVFHISSGFANGSADMSASVYAVAAPRVRAHSPQEAGGGGSLCGSPH